jgi:carbon-monoxide dehydrogenase large subunit
VGRPVKWTCDRHEAFLSDYQGRDLVVEAELALDADGNFFGLRGANISNAGAHTISYVPLTKGVEIMTGRTASRVPISAPARWSATRPRPTPIAAPAGPRSISCSSGWSIWRAASTASIRSRSGAAT